MLIGAGDHDCDDIVIEVHETKWWQKNTEVCVQVHFMLVSCEVMAPLADCLINGHHGNVHGNCALVNRMHWPSLSDSL